MSAYDDLASLVRFRPLERAARRDIIGGRRMSPFGASWSSTVELLARELTQHGARNTLLEVDFLARDLRLDGLPRADRTPRSPDIVLSFDATRVHKRPHLRYEVGTFTDWRANVRAVALSLERLRSVDRYGVTKLGEQYRGFEALGPGSDVQRGRELITQHGGAREALMATHPDRGGDPEDFATVQAARGAQ